MANNQKKEEGKKSFKSKFQKIKINKLKQVV